MNSLTLKQCAHGLQGSAPGPLHFYDGFQFGVFMGFLSAQLRGSLIAVPALGLCSFCRSVFDVIVLFYLTFYFIIFLKIEEMNV